MSKEGRIMNPMMICLCSKLPKQGRGNIKNTATNGDFVGGEYISELYFSKSYSLILVRSVL